MIPAAPVMYLGCPRCDGLLCTQETYAHHAAICDGNRQTSSCQLFACPRDMFLQLFSKDIELISDFSMSEVDDTVLKQGKHEIHDPSTSSSLHKTNNVHILGRTRSQDYTVVDKDALSPNIDSPNMDMSDVRLDVLGNDVDNRQLTLSEAEQEAETMYKSFVQETENIFSKDDNQIDACITDEEESCKTVLETEDAADECHWDEFVRDNHTVYRCRLCSHESNYLGFMKRHIRAHNNGDVLQCDQCDFSTIWRSQLQVHKSKHAQPNFLCEHCPRRFKNKSSLTRHSAKKHNGKSNFLCTYSQDCGFVGVNSANLRDHMRKHTGELLFCDYGQCKFMTKFEKALGLHKAKHQGITRYVCEICGYKTIETGSFKRHCLIHNGKKLFKCPDCSYKGTSRYVVVKHIYGKHIDHKRYACNRCDFKTAYYSGLSMHLMAHEGIKPYKCSLCPYRSNLSNKVKRHCSQKHVQNVAKVIKVENCLKFDVKDYLNPDVHKIDVKVIRLNGDGEEEQEEEVEDEAVEAATAPAALHAGIVEEEGLLCESRISSLPQGSPDDLEDISIMGGGFNLCSDPSFPLDTDTVPQSFHSEDSNSLFVTRNVRLDTSAGPVLDLNKFHDVHKGKIPYLDSPETSLQMTEGAEQILSDISENFTNVKANPFRSVGLGLRSESVDNLCQIKSPMSKSTESIDTLDLATQIDNKIMQSQEIPVSFETKTHLPMLSTSSPLFQVIQLPSTLPMNQASNCLAEPAKPLRSLLSPDIMKSLSGNASEVNSLADASQLQNQISIVLKVPAGGGQASGKTAILSLPQSDANL
ncbi:uncharacterized protein [Haliotis cracherodii]|uniref:uncharacterized protein n=1 Tax=Haliotis cracherodii TaxID=6455 RepID=UPI0039E8DB72